MTPDSQAEAGRQLERASGPWHFVTRGYLRHVDGSLHHWSSRAHRKHIATKADPGTWINISSWLWAPGQLNWWIGIIFAVGASLFAAGCVLSLVPALPPQLGFTPMEVNAVFFAGSIPFTTAAYLQLFQAANTPNLDAAASTPAARKFFGWRPLDIGWLSCALQFPGTLLFNINTFDAMAPGLDWQRQDLDIWVPNILGSLLFLASGYLAFAETCHRHLAWRPGDLSWWITFINLLGCIGFMIAAVFAFVPQAGAGGTWVWLSLVFTLQGAVCFLLGSLLMLPEGAAAAPQVVDINQ